MFLDVIFDVFDVRLDTCLDQFMGGLEAFAQDVNDRSVKGFKLSGLLFIGKHNLNDRSKSWCKVLLNYLRDFFKATFVEKDYPLEVEFWAQHIKEHVKTLALIKFRDLIDKLIHHRECRPGIRESGHHATSIVFGNIPKMRLHLNDFLLESLVLSLKLLLITFGSLQLGHESFHAVTKFTSLRLIGTL
jgi:hypothetical protein